MSWCPFWAANPIFIFNFLIPPMKSSSRDGETQTIHGSDFSTKPKDKSHFELFDIELQDPLNPEAIATKVEASRKLIKGIQPQKEAKDVAKAESE